MGSLGGFLIQLFVAISEKVFLRWYESAKNKQANDAKKAVEDMADDAVAKRLRDKYTRD